MSHTTPILLLDDIFDRLDTSRVEEIVKLVSSSDFGQIFISDTNRESLDEILLATDHDYHIYKVENGDISRVFE
jgi:DNA replication and repair protein RecF